MKEQQKLHRHTVNRGPRLIRLREVRDLTGLSRSYIYALAADGRFPKSVALVPGGSSRAWVEAEVTAWLQQRIAERDQEVANA
ncbi:AlpA family phage regulatory protein [Parahaliea sp. F7430]|uniref:AlpA family phage regulatory protein n=1 Tax=Sediminihaliea albiluteola TaxID=2758564 RepID=A0A7W2TXZ2_9GAMM|nr:AlpA family phage regulatory protein [Sediminihaliea albiluteola]MBA6413970.1 AlpA family phage regulatory protein [Sediminihaliea albiluteola]